MPPFKCVLHYFLVSVVSISQAYWLVSDSCEDYEDMIVAGMKDAFSLAQAGLDALEDIQEFYSQADRPPPNPTQQAQFDLLGYLFESAHVSNPDDQVLRRIVDTFKLVLGFRESSDGSPSSRPPGPSLPDGGFVVYCNYKRLLENQDCQGKFEPKKACDIDLIHVVDMGDDFFDCKNSFNTDKTEAWTVHYNGDKPGKPAQIQLCPWYLQKSVDWRFKYLTSLDGAKAFLSRVYEWNLAITGERTMMDAAGLIGHTFLHELTHAISENPTSDIGKGNSYGWRNCGKLSPQGGYNNADNYAYFELGARFIKPQDGTAAQRPMADGRLQALPVEEDQRKRQYQGESYSNFTQYLLDAPSLLPNIGGIMSTTVAISSSRDVLSEPLYSSKARSSSPKGSLSTLMPTIRIVNSTGASGFIPQKSRNQTEANTEISSTPILPDSNSTRPSSSTTLAPWEGPLPPSPLYNALWKTDPPKKTDGPSSTRTTTGCDEMQTARSCVVALSTTTAADEKSTRTVTTSCTDITSCSATDTTSTITLVSYGSNVPTVTPIYEHFVWDGNREWYYLQQLILDDLKSATWPIVTWSGTSTEISRPDRPAETSNVDLGELTCGSPDTEPTDQDAVLRKRTDQGNPEFWMSLGKEGQSGLIDGVSVFCNFLAVTKWIIDPTFPPRTIGIQLSYNEHYYDPIFFGIEWRKADDCPVLDFVNDRDEALKTCNSRLNTIINGCDTSSNGHYWWKQGGTFFRDCLEWQIFRDTWKVKDGDSVPTKDSYRPPKKCREIEDCDCLKSAGMKVCADSEEFSDLGWCSCGDIVAEDTPSGGLLDMLQGLEDGK